MPSNKMIEFNFGYHGRARVWLGDSSIPSAMNIQQMKVCRKVNGRGCVTHPSVTVETCVAHGGRATYGLLGGFFTEGDPSERLDIIVDYFEEPGEIWNDALAGDLDTVSIGMDPAFAEDVLDHLVHTDLIRDFPPGTFHIHRAAMGAIGSCKATFRGLIDIMALIMTHPDTIEVGTMKRILESVPYL